MNLVKLVFLTVLIAVCVTTAHASDVNGYIGISAGQSEFNDACRGCDDTDTDEWNFPVICFILPFLWYFPAGLVLFFILTGGGYIVDFLSILLGVLAIIITVLDIIFNCGYS